MRKFISFLMLFCVCAGMAWGQTATEEMKPSQILPSMGIPEHQFYVIGTKAGGQYWTNTTSYTQNVETAGKFAFYAVPGLQNCYYIYNINDGKWINYNKTNRDNQYNFVEPSDNFDANAYWEITPNTMKNTTVSCYQLRPTNYTTNQAGTLSIKTDRYANWFEGTKDENKIGLWQQGPTVDEGSAWSFLPVDISEDLNVLLSQRIAVANEILSKNVVYTTGNNLLTTENISSIVSSPFTSTQEGSISKIVDNDAATHWHSDYSGGEKINGSHYIVVNLGDATPEMLSFSYSRRANVVNDHTTRWAIYGVPEDETGISEASRNGLTLLAMVSTPMGSDTFNNLPPFKTKGFKKFRFYSDATNQNRGYFHIGEFQLNQMTIAESNEDRVKELYAAITTAESVETATQTDIDNLNEKINQFTISEEDKNRGQAVLNLNGVGYPAANSSVRIALKNKLENEATSTTELNDAITAFKTSTEIALPESGKAYQFAFVANDESNTNYQIVANGTSLSASATAPASTFYCVKFTNVNGEERFAFISEEGKFLGYNALTDSYITHIGNDKRLQNDFAIAAMTGVTSNKVDDAAEERFGTVYLTTDNRILESLDKKGCFILKNSDANLPFDKSDAPYYNGTFTSAIKMTEVTDYTASDAVLIAASTIEPLTKGYNRIGEGIGKYAYTFGNVTDGTSFNDFETAVKAANAVVNTEDYSFTINQPTAGFYRIKSMNGNDNNKKGKYLYVSDATYGLSQTEALNSIMYIDENHNIVNYTSGLHVNHYSAPATVGTEAVAWTFMENANITGAYTLKYNTGDQPDYFLSDWTGGVTFGNNDANAAWTFEEVTTLPVTIGEAKAATLYAPVALTIPAGVKAYAGSVSGEYVVLTPVSTTIPANTGVILMAEEAKSYDFAVTTTENTVEDNVLTGTVATIETPADANIYTLQAPENVLKMKRYNGATLAGFKAYLSMTASQVQAFKLDLGEATGIESILNDANGKMVIYDMNGRRVQQMSKGLYIVNGKKVLVK